MAISNLNAKTSEIQSSDTIAINPSSEGIDYKVTMSNVKDFMQDNLSFTGTITRQDYAPSSAGFSVSVLGQNYFLYMRPTGTLASGTIVLPTVVSEGGMVFVYSSQQITSLTVAVGDATHSIENAPTDIQQYGSFKLWFDSVNKKWIHLTV